MNINLIKKEIEKNINKKAVISVFGLRNRIDRYEGTIYKVYPNIFTMMVNDEEKSFTYRDIITGDIKIKYL